LKSTQSFDLHLEDRNVINDWIIEIIEDEYKSSVMKKMIIPLFAANKGKKLRPLIARYSYKLIAGEDADETKLRPLCAALEISHNASLIVDDIFDKDELRRGEQSFFVKFGTFAALSSAYNLSAFVFDLATRTDNNQIVREVGKVGTALSSALFLSKDLVNKRLISEEFFMDVLYRKTTALFEAASKSGTLLATDDQTIVNEFSEFGYNFGTAYQLRDDVLGIVGTMDDLGKLPISDIDNRFQSLITIEAIKQGTPDQIATLKAFYLDNEPLNIETIRSILIETGAIRTVMNKSIELRNRAIAFLNKFPDTRSKNMLLALVEKITFDGININ
jgi:geranylgeranyl pyrophosphate synthase